VPLGGTCTADIDCCDGICLNGKCTPNYSDCLPLGAACVLSSECCSGFCDPVKGVCSIT
jgi:hypothetical protein